MSEDVCLNFPLLDCPHTAKQEVFVGYGSSENIAVRWNDEKGQTEVISQQNHWSGQNCYVAKQPSLPLISPNQVKDPFFEPVLGEINQLNTRLRKFIGFIKTQDKAIERCQEYREKLLSVLEKLMKAGSDFGITYPHGCQVSAAARHIKGLFHSEVSFKTANMHYSGGCLQYVPLFTHDTAGDDCQPTSGLVLYPSGPELNNLALSSVHLTTEKTLQISQKNSIMSLGGRICQISAAAKQRKAFCCVRLEESVSVYRITPPDAIHLISTHTFTGERPTHACMSPYLPGECLMITTSGNLYRWNPVKRMFDDLCDSVLQKPVLAHEGLSARFAVDESWFACHYGSNPRLARVSDHTGVSLISLISSDSEPQELFTLPHVCLHKKEWVTASSPVPNHSFYFVIATHYTILLLDERLPDHPLLVLSHPLLHPPLYLSPASVSSTACHLLAATQDSSETVLYQFTVQHDNTPPLSTSTVLRVSKTDDFAHIAGRQGESVNPVVMARRLAVPFAGCCYVPHPLSSDFSVLQLTGFGDLFSQEFYLSLDDNSPNDKNKSHGPGLADDFTLPQPDSSSFYNWREWLREAHTQLVQCHTGPYQCKTYDAARCVSGIKHTLYPHVLCPICMPSTSTASTDRDPPSNSCFACRNSFDEGCRLIQALQEDKVHTNTTELAVPDCLAAVDASKFTLQSAADTNGEEVIPEGQQPSHVHPLSAIILKLWNEDYNVTEEVLLRDKSVKKIHERLVKQYRIRTGDSDLSSSDSETESCELSDHQILFAQNFPETSVEENPCHSPTHVNIATSASGINAPSPSVSNTSSGPSQQPGTPRSRKRRHSELSHTSSVDYMLTDAPGFLVSPSYSKSVAKENHVKFDDFLRLSPSMHSPVPKTPRTPKSKPKTKWKHVIGF